MRKGQRLQTYLVKKIWIFFFLKAENIFRKIFYAEVHIKERLKEIKDYQGPNT